MCVCAYVCVEGWEGLGVGDRGVVRDVIFTFTLARLVSPRYASVRVCLHWLSYHETVGGVNRVKQDNIITNIFLISVNTVLPSGCSICYEVCK